MLICHTDFFTLLRYFTAFFISLQKPLQDLIHFLAEYILGHFASILGTFLIGGQIIIFLHFIAPYIFNTFENLIQIQILIGCSPGSLFERTFFQIQNTDKFHVLPSFHTWLSFFATEYYFSTAIWKRNGFSC